MGFVEKQFFPNSDRPELTVEVNLPPGSAFAATDRSVKNIEKAIMAEPEAKVVTSYIGQGMPRFILPMNPELPNPAFAQIVVLTEGPAARDALKIKLRQPHCPGRVPGSTRAGETIRIRPTRPVSGTFPRHGTGPE